MVHFHEGFCVDRVRVARQLVDLGIDLLSDVPEEIFLGGRIARELLRDVKVLGSCASFELAEDYHFIWLSYQQGLVFSSLL